jgi:uncharacterized membrane protein
MIKKSLLVVLLFHLLLYIVVILNIPVIRQIVVFIYLSFIPGFALIKLLKLTEIMFVEKILFIVGLSLAFLMFAGILINELFFALGISTPLLSTPLLISLSFLTLILSFVAHRQNLPVNIKLNEDTFNLKNAGLKCFVVLPLILGVVGSLYANVYILSLMIISIVTIYLLSIFSSKFDSIRSLNVIIFLISFTLIIQVLLTSKYVQAWDTNIEFYVFKLTANSGHWTLISTIANSLSVGNYNSMSSITILPTIYYSLMNASGEVIFKSLYPFVFSLVPVTLFTIYSKQLGKTRSVLSTLFFISGSMVFYGFGPLSANRQIVGTLFLALSTLIILNKRLPVGTRRFLLVIFGGALIVSHYSLALIYLFLMFSLFMISQVKGYSNNILNYKLIAFLFAMSFVWYGFTGTILTSAYQNLRSIFYTFFSDFGSLTSRIGLLSGSHPAYGSNINFAGDINWSSLVLANLFVAIGLTILLVKSKKWPIEPQYRLMCILSGVILLLCFTVPNLSNTLQIPRFYSIAILFLAPCFVLGGELVVDVARDLLKKITGRRLLLNIKKFTTILLVTLLILYFFSQSGFVNIVARAVPLSYSLDYTRGSTSSDKNIQIGFSQTYISEQDVFSASWLLNHKVETAEVLADFTSRTHVLVSYGLIPNQLLIPLTNTTIPPKGSYIYLGTLNVVNGLITTSITEGFVTNTGSFNTSEISTLLDQYNIVYSNGNSQLGYFAPVH